MNTQERANELFSITKDVFAVVNRVNNDGLKNFASEVSENLDKPEIKDEFIKAISNHLAAEKAVREYNRSKYGVGIIEGMTEELMNFKGDELTELLRKQYLHFILTILNAQIPLRVDKPISKVFYSDLVGLNVDAINVIINDWIEYGAVIIVQNAQKTETGRWSSAKYNLTPDFYRKWAIDFHHSEPLKNVLRKLTDEITVLKNLDNIDDYLSIENRLLAVETWIKDYSNRCK